MKSNLERLYTLKVPEIQALFISAMQEVVDESQINEMVNAIENNDIEGLYKASGFNPVVLNSFLDSIESIYEDAGNMFVSDWPKRIRTPFGLARSVFNIRNEKVEQELKLYSSNFVTNITNEVKENLRYMLSEGMSRGSNPRETALNIVGRINPLTKKREGGILGLSNNQVKWVANVRRYLENLDEQYFELGLRDKRFDSVVKKAISENKRLTKDEIEKLISAYNKKALKFRADAVSRTETMQAINRAERASIQQNIDEGLLKPEQVTKWWDDTGDGRTRLSHIELGRRYNKDNQIPFDEPFETITGSRLLYPGDTSLGASLKEIINCRCKVEYNVDFLAEYL